VIYTAVYDSWSHSEGTYVEIPGKITMVEKDADEMENTFWNSIDILYNSIEL